MYKYRALHLSLKESNTWTNFRPIQIGNFRSPCFSKLACFWVAKRGIYIAFGFNSGYQRSDIITRVRLCCSECYHAPFMFNCLTSLISGFLHSVRCLPTCVLFFSLWTAKVEESRVKSKEVSYTENAVYSIVYRFHFDDSRKPPIPWSTIARTRRTVRYEKPFILYKVESFRF